MSLRKRKRPALASIPGVKLIAAAYYLALTTAANVFGAVFWFFEQRRCRIADRIDNEGHSR
jgi:hypothetical protein